MPSTDLQLGLEQTLSDIQNLQSIEQNLFAELNAGASTLTQQQKQDLISKINEVSQMRANLYQNLSNVYSYYGSNANSSNALLVDQTNAITIVEQELNESKKRLEYLENDTNQTMKMVEINTYYGEKYSDYVDILKSIVIICIPVLFLAILHRAGMIPNTLYSFSIVIIILFGVIWIGRKIIWTWFHSNKNYQEYTWSFDKSKAPPIDISAASNMGGPWASMPNLACMGQDCCPDGFTYVSSEDRCMPNEEAAALLGAKTDASSGASASRIWGRRRGGVNDLPEVIQGGFGGL